MEALLSPASGEVAIGVSLDVHLGGQGTSPCSCHTPGLQCQPDVLLATEAFVHAVDGRPGEGPSLQLLVASPQPGFSWGPT